MESNWDISTTPALIDGKVASANNFDCAHTKLCMLLVRN
jgi:hypothetical protein